MLDNFDRQEFDLLTIVDREENLCVLKVYLS